MLDTVEINHVQHISFAQSRLTDAVSVILSELLSYEHPSNAAGFFYNRILYLLRASSMALAAVLPAPMARMTVAAPVTASPPA